MVVLGLSVPARADYSAGLAAYERGDYVVALREWRPLAEQGDAKAQFKLGVMYEFGQGVPQDYAEALQWYRKAAAQGVAEAQYNLGSMYLKGQGVPQDYAEAVKWYRKPAKRGGAKAQYNLGIMYRTGLGVPQDYAEAVKWYRKAAAQGGKEGKAARQRLAALGVSIEEEADARSMVMAIQRRLTDLGYGPGPADGIIGSKTRAAIQAFQSVAGLAETGKASRDLLNRLNEEAQAVKPALPVPPSAPAAIH